MSTVELTAELVLAAHAELGEGPVWDQVSERLLWVDITAPALQIYRPGTGETRTVPVDRYLGAVWPRASGGLIAAVADGFAALDEASGVLTMLRPVEADRPENRFNDAACDPAGRFFGGTMGVKAEPDQGSLYRLDPDLSVHVVAAPVTISNGLGWSPDNTLMYYIDTPTKRVDVFDYDLDTGDVTNRRTFADLPGPGLPDGLAVDTDGQIWVAMHGGGTVVRLSPDGRIVATVRLPVLAVTSCAFDAGGSLYITTSATLEPQPADPRLAGGLYRVETSSAGLPVVAFAG
jgi:sugar lactone lactonase YvrE